MIKKGLYIAAMIFTLTSVAACVQEKKFTSPKGYNLENPKKYNMPESLSEISGIAFNNGNADTVYAQQDEDGKLFYLRLGDKAAKRTKFAKHGDYEDVAIANNQVIMLKSNGTLYTFPLSEIRSEEAMGVKEFKGTLAKGEYEGMYADAKTSKLYVLCKNCNDAKESKVGKGFILDLQQDSLKVSGEFELDVKQIAKLVKEDKIQFRPSALAKNPVTGEWFIVSSVNKLLVIADDSWKVKAAYELDSKLFLQPEGIAFDKKGNLYISNEGDELSRGNILMFKFASR